jgi:hypothetical protein
MTITFPQADVDAFFKQTERLESELGWSHKPAIRTAARQLLRSAGVVTKQAPKYRDYKRKGKARKGAKGLFDVSLKHASKPLKNAAAKTGLQYNGERLRLPAADVKELKKRGFVKIGARGLAKISWQMIASRGRIGNVKAGKTAPASHMIKAMARDRVKWSEKFSVAENYVHMQNDLEYIEKAIIGGQSAMEGLMGKAARGLENTIKRTLELKAKKV